MDSLTRQNLNSLKGVNLRKYPEKYIIGRGEFAVLTAEPYKSEILPFWRFKTPHIAKESAKKIYSLFLSYLKERDFVGADMARKYLQMGFTRSKRYANRKSGKKYDGPVPMDKKGESGAHGRKELPKMEDKVKAECAEIFKEYLTLVRENVEYKKLKPNSS